jgi:hypothetical protein
MKNMFLLTSLALFACWGSNAQSATEHNAARTRYGVYTQFGYSKPNDGFLTGMQIIDEPRSFYSLGMSVRHQLSGRWVLSTGAALTYKKFNVWGASLPDVTHPAYNQQDFGGWNCLQLVQTTLYAHTTELGVELPVLMQYYIVKNRFFVSTGLEMNAGMFTHHKSAYLGYSGEITSINKSQHITAYQLSLPLGFGINIPVSGRNIVSIEPGIRMLLAEYQAYDGYQGLYTLRTSFYF